MNSWSNGKVNTLHESVVVASVAMETTWFDSRPRESWIFWPAYDISATIEARQQLEETKSRLKMYQHLLNAMGIILGTYPEA